MKADLRPRSGDTRRVRIRKALPDSPEPFYVTTAAGRLQRNPGLRHPTLAVDGPGLPHDFRPAASQDRSCRRRAAPSTTASGRRGADVRQPAAICALVRSPGAPDAQGCAEIARSCISWSCSSASSKPCSCSRSSRSRRFPASQSLMPRLQRTCQVIEVVDSARTSLKVLRSLASFQPGANVLQFRVEVRPTRDLRNSRLHHLQRAVADFSDHPRRGAA